MSEEKMTLAEMAEFYTDERGVKFALLAQAEATRPRFVRLGEHTINVAQIAYVDWHGADCKGNRAIEITFCAVNNTAALGLVFRGDECDVVEPVLRSVLEPLTVAAVDVPQLPEVEAADAVPFTVVN